MHCISFQDEVTETPQLMIQNTNVKLYSTPTEERFKKKRLDKEHTSIHTHTYSHTYYTLYRCFAKGICGRWSTVCSVYQSVQKCTSVYHCVQPGGASVAYVGVWDFSDESWASCNSVCHGSLETVHIQRYMSCLQVHTHAQKYKKKKCSRLRVENLKLQYSIVLLYLCCIIVQ